MTEHTMQILCKYVCSITLTQAEQINSDMTVPYRHILCNQLLRKYNHRGKTDIPKEFQAELATTYHPYKG